MSPRWVSRGGARSVRLGAAALIALGLARGPAPAAAQIGIVDQAGLSVTLAGYLRSLTGLQDRGYEVPGLERTSGFHGQVVRLKWKLETNGVIVDVHNRLQARVTSGEGNQPALGFGVSAVPGRSVDLSTDLVARPGLRVWHDIDRLSVAFRTPVTDLTIGRQPITWGISTLFPVADLWAAFSPFELDTEEKPGIDAVRALFYPADDLEVDAVVADRGSLEDLSAGIRATRSLASADVWAGAGKLWEQAMLMGGVTFLREETRLRAEAVLPYDLEAREMSALRATVGVDWIRGRLSLTGEAHYNGIGVSQPADYLAHLQDPRFMRGESYFLSRAYAGGAGSWSPDDEGRVRLAGSALFNLGDGSAAVVPMVDYDFGQATSVSVGGLLSFGETPVIALPPSLRTEFGAYGHLAFTRVSIYF